MTDKIKIFDTTLRDGEQAPGFSMNKEEKLGFAHQLELLGVDVIEAGFPVASRDDFEAVESIAKSLKTTEVCGLARCHSGDIDAALMATEKAKKPRIHVFIATSDIHLEYKLKISRDEAIKKAVEAIRQCKKHCDRVDFSPEDAGRSDRDFLVEILSEAIKAGADTLNIPDTVGYLSPAEFGDLILYLNNNVPGIKNCIISTHCHNDLGMAVANSLSGALNGARQIECTINGIGERAGNAAMEEVVMAIKTRPELFKARTGINTPLLLKTSRMLSSITGQHVQINKAIVGDNAFAHEAGIHQHGLLKNKFTYEIMKPDDVGWNETNFVLGKHSGRNAVLDRLNKLGIKIAEADVAAFMMKFKDLADGKKHIYDDDLILLTKDKNEEMYYAIKEMKVEAQTGKKATATIKLKAGGDVIEGKATGNGSVDAVYNAIIKVTGFEGVLTKFNVDAISPQKDAIANANIGWLIDDVEIRGRGTSTDTVTAIANALIDVVNRYRIQQQHEEGLSGV
ncbi:2-isopropylmalate synthase [Patescibacteria group bacterium]|nr:2-isopropylmalate synthase [Patescibacteria group bacterium]